MLDAIFIDTLDMDLERLQRVNRTLACIPEEVESRRKPGLRTVDTLVIRPSEPIAEIAAAYVGELPRMMRWVMSRMGVLEPNGARVLSYLLFERGYCRHLMRLGVSDALAQRERILSFLGYDLPFRRRSEGRRSEEQVNVARALEGADVAAPLSPNEVPSTLPWEERGLRREAE
jgi:hypothetical protein